MRASWIERELGKRRLEARQVRRQNSVATKNVLADLTNRQRLGAAEAAGTKRRKSKGIEEVRGRVFSRRPKAAAGRLRLEFFF